MKEASHKAVPSLALAIDIGGTFTDIVCADLSSGSLKVGKVLTTSPDPAKGVLEAIARLLEKEDGFDVETVARAIHGTTLVTNALIERKGARTGLLITQGFRDALEIRREGRYDIYDLFLELPEPLVERRLRLEVPERLNVRGESLLRLDEDAVRKACEHLCREGVEAIAISFLHSYANPVHERSAEAIAREEFPHIPISVSHRVAPEMREYERTSTTVANAYVQPLARRYLEELERGVRAAGIEAPLHIMLSNGGSCSVETAAEFPVRLVESGPSGGALAAEFWCRRLGREDVFAFDMGGTTAKAILSERGAGKGSRSFPIINESEVARAYRFKRGSGLPLLVPVLDMLEIGAGGGSIAHLSEMGLPVVGPESAGAFPGPACYGQGGDKPTVTDADLLLGHLNAHYFLGGSMPLHLELARQAVAKLAKTMQMPLERLAWGICRLVDENMANAARVHAAERGLDIRGYTLVATGGAGPVHACRVAERLGIGTVLIPPAAGVGSAFGLLLAPISFDFAISYVARLKTLDLNHLNQIYDGMESQGLAVMRDARVREAEVRVQRFADMRYVGQGHEIRVAVPLGPLASHSLTRLRSSFDKEYRRIFGRLCDGVAIEAVHWRMTVSGPKPEMKTGVGSKRRSERRRGFESSSRQVIFDPDAGPASTPVYNRYELPLEFRMRGPVIVEEKEATTVAPPGWTLTLDPTECLVLTR